ncbi:hypothetical protein SGRA_0391 [Saprospira grandis str. Lewin]|uniref:Uncharacterized protein n=1 Tax=Saprospira grandis (strain Lewin) TaxID=984262 RepID=H6L8Z4_SAPGL|nr:hypothetical protein SGRA_0391 [Saprospira grandis str. Lewin]
MLVKIRGCFWGCPSLCSGRAVSQLAGLLGPAQKNKFFARSGLRPLLSIPQPAGLRPFNGQG